MASCSSAAPPFDELAWREVLRQNSDPNVPSAQHLDPSAKAIVTSKVCAELAPSGRVRRWFRWAPAGFTVAAMATSTCSPNGASTRPRGELTTMLTGVHGSWSEAGEELPEAAVSRPCAALQERQLRLHDYCLPAARFEHAPPSETTWRRGVALIGNEAHTDNFHHFNRDMLFFARVFARGLLHKSEIANVIVTDHSDIVDWSAEHARVVLGPQLLRRTVFMPHRRGGVQPKKAALSNASMRSISASSSASAARFVCFDATVEKLVTDPVDRDDVAWLRARAYAACDVPAARDESKPRLLLLLLRGDTTLGDKPSTARQVVNGGELRATLTEYASELGLRLHATAFAAMSYCEQVRLAADSSILVGVHGQGITNGQFMRDDGLVVELFHGGRRPYWRAFDNVGHQPLYLGAGRPYVAAPYAESSCEMMRWKHAPECKSFVNASRLVGLMRQVRKRGLLHQQ